ncbi:hypothetical protein ACFL2D_02695 [Patescibacteria group bacterium]
MLIVLGMFLCVFLFGISVQEASAETYNVDLGLDDDDTDCLGGGTNGGCTIRDAFTEANATLGDHTIVLGTDTYDTSVTLTTDSDQAFTIQGAGEGNSIIDAEEATGGALRIVGSTNSTATSLTDFSVLTAPGAEYGISISPEGAGPIPPGYDPIAPMPYFTGDISIDSVTITGTPINGLWIGEGPSGSVYYLDSNVSVTNMTIATPSGSGIALSLQPEFGEILPRPPRTGQTSIVTGTVDISRNTITGGAGGSYNSGINFDDARLLQDTSVDSNIITLSGGAGSTMAGIAAGESLYETGSMGDFAVTNNIITGDPDLGYGGIVAGLDTTGEVTVSGNTISGVTATTTNAISAMNAFCVTDPDNCSELPSAQVNNNTVTVDSAVGSPQGMVAASARAVEIEKNIVELSDGVGGFMPQQGIVCTNNYSGSETTSTCNIRKNLVTGFEGYGIYALAFVDDVDLIASIENNVVYRGSGVNAGGIAVGVTSGAQSVTTQASIVNNSVYSVVSGTGSAGTNGAVVIESDDSQGGTDDIDVVVYNNVFQENTNGLTIDREVGSEDVVVLADHNLVYRNFADGGANYKHLPKGPADIVSDAIFVSEGNGNLRLRRYSPGVDSGANSFVTVASPDDDYDDEVRPQGDAKDRGAFETEYVEEADEDGEEDEAEEILPEAGSSSQSFALLAIFISFGISAFIYRRMPFSPRV